MSPGATHPSAARTRLGRADRREQILAAATRAFARTGFSATGLDDVAAESGVSRVILYRHFDSKADLYRAVLDRARNRLGERVGSEDFTSESVGHLIEAAVEDPAGFRLLFQHAAREPEFREDMDLFRADVESAAHRQLRELIPDAAWARWASALAPTVVVDAIIAWLDAGQPDPDSAAERVLQAVGGVVQAALPRAGRPPGSSPPTG
jgi:AcrR family transcriptional regulator